MNSLVRLAAARLADALPVRERIAVAGSLLVDPLRAVRIEAAHALAGVPPAQLTAAQRAAWDRAADEYVATQRYNADRPEARANLGTFYTRIGKFEVAQAEFRAAIALDPRFVPAYANGADAYREQAREHDAVRMLEAGLAVGPGSAPLHHALGLAYARQKQATAALRSLEQRGSPPTTRAMSMSTLSRCTRSDVRRQRLRRSSEPPRAGRRTATFSSRSRRYSATLAAAKPQRRRPRRSQRRIPTIAKRGPCWRK